MVVGGGVVVVVDGVDVVSVVVVGHMKDVGPAVVNGAVVVPDGGAEIHWYSLSLAYLVNQVNSLAGSLQAHQ